MAIVLSLLSPFFAEVVSGSTPPLEMINPITFLFLWGFYGSGVLLIREMWLKTTGGYLSLMFLGFSYGVIEEGLFVKSWFDPHWPDLSILGVYGRIWGINAVWATWLTIFHSFMSIWVPIVIFQILYPQYRDSELLSKKAKLILLLIFIFIGLLMFFFLNPYKPPFLQYLFSIFLLTLFIRLAKKVKYRTLKDDYFRHHSFQLGLFFSVGQFLLFVFIPHTPIPWPIPILLGAPLVIYFFWRQNGMKDIEILLILIGSLSFWLLFYDTILEIKGFHGELILGWLTFALLFRKYLRMRGGHKGTKMEIS